jgi:hypothetical protein
MTGSGAAFGQPSWSPDGSTVPGHVGPDEAHKIWVYDIATGTERLRSEDPAAEYWPAGLLLAATISASSRSCDHAPWVPCRGRPPSPPDS